MPGDTSTLPPGPGTLPPATCRSTHQVEQHFGVCASTRDVARVHGEGVGGQVEVRVGERGHQRLFRPVVLVQPLAAVEEVLLAGGAAEA